MSFWTAFGIFAIIGGILGVIHRRFMTEAGIIFGRPAVFLGYFFIIIGTILIVLSLTSVI